MRYMLLSALLAVGLNLCAQSALTLDSLRTMALKNNKELAIANSAREKATWERKAAHTKYFPRIDVVAGYTRTGDEIQLLSDDKQSTLNNLGTNLVGSLSQGFQQGWTSTMSNPQFQQALGAFLQRNPELAPMVQNLQQQLPAAMQQAFGQTADKLNAAGQNIVDAFRTDTRNIFAASVLLTQPIYMGGKIVAYNKITKYSEQLAESKLQGLSSNVILSVDKAYWQIINLTSKRRLATQYRDMLRQLEGDVEKMVAEGVATKANLLSVSVKLNEAEMTLAKVNDGLSLSKMLLCQLCGLPLDSDPVLEDEQKEDLFVPTDIVEATPEEALNNRAEIQQLSLATDIYKQKVNVVRADYLPSLALTGGYAISNPNVFNGFQNKFRGTWGVGVMLKVPVWNWLECKYKVKAAKIEAENYKYQLEEAREKIELQVNQQTFLVNQANRKYALTLKNLEGAEENLRIAQIGHKEGVITTTDLLGAQTAWLSAQSDKIDAQVDIHITRATLNNVLGR